jgi:CAAX prenyl protease-like protein
VFHALPERLRGSPLAARALPFLVFAVMTAFQGRLGEGSPYWVYLAKTVVGAWLLWLALPALAELRWEFTWRALIAGVAVFLLWVGLDPWYPHLGSNSDPWNPGAHFGEGTLAAALFVVVRFVGSVGVVPALEEVFYRSLLYRYCIRPDFLAVPLSTFGWVPFLITAAIFGFTHREWLAGILCAAVYQGLVCWRGRLGEAVTAHAVTNLLLGGWVVWKGAWHFW